MYSIIDLFWQIVMIILFLKYGLPLIDSLFKGLNQDRYVDSGRDEQARQSDRNGGTNFRRVEYTEEPRRFEKDHKQIGYRHENTFR